MIEETGAIMKNFTTTPRRAWLAAAAAILLGAGGAASVHAGEMTLSVEPKTAPLTKEGSVVVTGAGFEPGAPIVMLMQTIDGLESDIGEYLDPALEVGEDGAFSVTYAYGAFVRRKLVDANAYKLSVTDENYNAQASTEIVFE
ncbi:MAG: hypothetical protein R3C97_09650 [Geminicoccaceae bacterium]